MRVVVIGAGVGGMVAALRLAKAGHAVTVLEQNERIGGKLGVWEPDAPGAGKFRFDTGPHVLTMPWVIEDLFRDLGFAPGDHLDLVRIDPICRYHFPDGEPFDAAAEPDEAARRIARRFPGDERGFRDLLSYARRVYEATVGPFLCQDFAAAVRGIPTPAQWRQLAGFLALRPWQTLHRRVARHVRDPRLRRIFDLYAFYNGSSPLRASAIFAIIASVQWEQGTFYLRGGLRTYAEALRKMADALGVEIRLGAAAERICIEGPARRGRVVGVDLAGDGCVPAEVVVCNADPLTAYRDLVPEAHRPRAFQDQKALQCLEPSTSAFVLLLGARGAWPHLAHYNSFLPENAAEELDAVFRLGVPADDPVIGVTCQSVTEPDCAPPGHSNLFVMTSPPALSDRFAWTDENTAAYRERVLDLLEERCGLAGLRERIVCEQVWTPETFAARYGAFRGSLYGLSSNRWRQAFLRPPNQARGVEGLFFVGGGTHPGGGLPLVTLGGKIVAEAVLRRQKIKPGFHRESRAPSKDGH